MNRHVRRRHWPTDFSVTVVYLSHGEPGGGECHRNGQDDEEDEGTGTEHFCYN
jgi:hypothetical protein